MRGFKKAVAILMICILMFTSCEEPDRTYDEKEVTAAAEELLKKAEILNTVYYGEGIHYLVTSYQNGVYYEADAFHLQKLGFNSIAELQNLTRSTFTESYSELLFSTKLEPLTVDDQVITLARYYQVYDEDSGEPLYIMVHSKYTSIYDGLMEFKYSTLKAVGSKKETVFVEVDTVVKNRDGESQDRTLSVSLIEENYGWRIDSVCFQNFIENEK